MKAKGSIEARDLEVLIGRLMLLYHAREAVILHLGRYDIRLENFIHDEYTLDFPEEMTAEQATIIRAELEVLFVPDVQIPTSVPLMTEWKKPQ